MSFIFTVSNGLLSLSIVPLRTHKVMQKDFLFNTCTSWHMHTHTYTHAQTHTHTCRQTHTHADARARTHRETHTTYTTPHRLRIPHTTYYGAHGTLVRTHVHDHVHIALDHCCPLVLTHLAERVIFVKSDPIATGSTKLCSAALYPNRSSVSKAC